LQTAKQGIYKEYSVRNIPQNYLEKYFEKQGSTYKLSEDIKKMVNFSNINLYDEDKLKK